MFFPKNLHFDWVTKSNEYYTNLAIVIYSIIIPALNSTVYTITYFLHLTTCTMLSVMPVEESCSISSHYSSGTPSLRNSFPFLPNLESIYLTGILNVFAFFFTIFLEITRPSLVFLLSLIC